RSDVLECFGKPGMEAAADLAGPADVHRPLARIEHDSRLLALETRRFGDRFDVEIFQPGAQRVLDLRETHPSREKDATVNVDFHAHAVLRSTPFEREEKDSTREARRATAKRGRTARAGAKS